MNEPAQAQMTHAESAAEMPKSPTTTEIEKKTKVEMHK
jgi:hypothetical protein